MTVNIAVWLAVFALGLALRSDPRAPTWNRWLWNAYFWPISPWVVAYAYTHVQPDANLVAALVLCCVTSYAILATGLVVGRLVSPDRDERGAIGLTAAFSNTSSLGFPLMQLAFGTYGLVLQGLYSLFCFAIPQVAVSATIARGHGRHGTGTRGLGLSFRRDFLQNPPLLAAIAAVGLRLSDFEANAVVEPLGLLGAWLVGPFGFLQLGLSMPRGRLVDDRRELSLGAMILTMRHGLSPLLLVSLGFVTGVDIPAPFIVASTMPVAFHLMTLAQIYDVRPPLVRLAVVTSTVIAVPVFLVAVAVTR